MTDDVGKGRAENTPLLEVKQVSKSFPGVRALISVSLQVMPSEVLSVIGENGAGKSTLMKILAGIQAPDSGEILWRGSPVRFAKTADAQTTGIALIHQELNLATNLTLAQNIFLGREPTVAGWIGESEMKARAAEYLQQVGLAFSPTTLVSRLSIGQQQQVEIAKALSCNAKLLIMDEPTSSLSTSESERLFALIAQLKASAVSIVYISHRLAEVKRLSDRIEVLRDGKNVGSLEGEDRTHDRMVRLMVGRELSQYFPHKVHPKSEKRLKVNGLRVLGRAKHAISLDVYGGEIVGIAGLVGAGRTELLECIMGLRPAMGGQVRVDGKVIPSSKPQSAIAAGLALVPEDRRHHGLMTAMAVDENLTLPSLRKRGRNGIMNLRSDRLAAQSQVNALRIKTPHLKQITAFLSGGNQQKIVFGKWMLCKPKVLLLDEPTRGVDIGAKQEIYGLMEKMASEGVAILFVSSEMEEILGMADRAIVMHEGRITGQLAREELSEESIMQLAVGNLHVGEVQDSHSR